MTRSKKYQTFQPDAGDLLSAGETDDDMPMAPGAERGASSKARLLQSIFSKVLYVITGMIIVLVLAVIILVLVFMGRQRPSDKRHFDFDDMFNQSFAVKQWAIDWVPNQDSYVQYSLPGTELPHKAASRVSDNAVLHHTKLSSNSHGTLNNGQHMDQDSNCDLRQFFPLDDSASQLLVSHEVLQQQNLTCGTPFHFDHSLRYFAFKVDIEHVFRFSTKGYHVIWDTHDKKWFSLSDQKQKTFNLCSDKFAYWVGEDNNIYKYDLEHRSNVPVTTDGDQDLIFNGISDWIYEEDVWETDVLLKVSPQCDRIAYLRLNDSRVQEYHFSTYKPFASYPHPGVTRYPVAGSPIPQVDVKVATCSGDNCEESLSYPLDSGVHKDGWVFQLEWSSNEDLLFTTTDRIQTVQQTFHWSSSGAASPKHIDTFKATDENLHWIQYPKSIVPISANSFVEIKPHNDYYHIRYTKTDQNGAEHHFLTSGSFNVISIMKVVGERIVFTATSIVDDKDKLQSTTQYVYELVYTDSRPTPKLLPGQDKEKSIYSASLSDSGNAYSLLYHGPQIPTSSLMRKVDSNFNRTVMENNDVLRELYSSNSLSLPSTEVVSVNLNDEDMDLLLVKPPNFRKSHKYPVLLYLYGGPGSKLVDQSYSSQHSSFSMYMASQGFVVATLDNRGTGKKKASFMQTTYKQLGTLETEDQMALKEYLSKKSWADGDNINLWGWSFGGFLTLSISTNPSYYKKGSKNTPFRAAVAVAPVTHWMYYNAAYTERYMQLPETNPEGYSSTSIVENIEPTTLKGTKLLLNHGSADDNVHPLNSMNLITEFQENEVKFDFMIYPNKDHGIDGPHTQRFLYRKISEHLINNVEQ